MPASERATSIAVQWVDDRAPFADESKIRIMAAAEALYGARSIESVSFREIAQAAGNRNTNAVQYHFGDRANLVQSIFAWRVWQMEPAREAALERVAHAGGVYDLATLMRILCEPILQLQDEQGRHTYAAFLSKYLLQHRPSGITHAADVRSDSNQSLRELLDRIRRLVNRPDDFLNEYSIVLAHLMVINTIVLCDAEDLARRDAAAFRSRFDVALNMAVAALEVCASGRLQK